jgi:hypothetical protein
MIISYEKEIMKNKRWIYDTYNKSLPPRVRDEFLKFSSFFIDNNLLFTNLFFEG